MSWTTLFHCVCQLKNTELQKTFCCTLKSFKEFQKHDRNTTVDNTMFNACENADHQSIELKTLVEHGERDNTDSVSRAFVVDKQQEKELAILRLMGEWCAEKMHRLTAIR